VSVDFDPVRLRPRRRRIDPVVLGVIGVVVALAAAVIKPWDQPPSAPATPKPAVAVVGPNPDPAQAPTAAPSPATLVLPTASAPGWPDVASAITTHDAWGVRAITVDQRLYRLAAGSPYHELWSPATASAGVETATVGRSGDPVSMLGFTSPLAEEPRDVRIWRVHLEDRLEWIEAAPIAAQPAEASLLFVRPRTDRGALTPWDPGRYRVDILVADGIHQLTVLVPDTHGVVPPLDRWASARPGSIPLSWGEVASAITSHDSWGVRVVTVDQRGFNPASGPSSFHELWSAATTIDGVATAVVGTYADPLSLLGITVPRATAARAVRIWRVHRDDQLEWVDAVPLAAQPSDASTLFIRPGVDGAPLTPWQPGRYRVDILSADGIHHLSVLVPDPFGIVPPLDTWTPDPPTIAARASDPSGVRTGLFATVDGVGVSLPARQTRPLDADAAWLDLSDRANDVVATAFLPHASGLGVMLTSHAAVASAMIQRLAPEGSFEAPEASGGLSESQGRTPYVLFAPPGETTWAPGVYAITVAWSDGAGAHQGTWHVELRPGLG
jgi:hypothetical protein